MVHEHLATYLNDHLAGAKAALELLEYLEAAQADTAQERFVAELRADVEADRQELKALMDRLQVAESGPRQATAWLAEKLAQLKLQMDDSPGLALHRLEGLEAVEVGIDGKRALWRALAAAAEAVPELQGVDYARLAQCAEEQHRRVEVERLQAAKMALGPG